MVAMLFYSIRYYNFVFYKVYKNPNPFKSYYATWICRFNEINNNDMS